MTVNSRVLVRFKRVVVLLFLLLVNSIEIYSGTYTFKKGYGIQFGWVKFKKISVQAVVNGGEQVQQRNQLSVKDVQADARYTTLNPMIVIMSANTQYNSMAPYNSAHKTASPTALPVEYTGQTQVANDNTSHLWAYDQMTAQSYFTTTSAYIGFTRHSSVIRIAYKITKPMTVKSLTLATDKALFVTKANLDIVEGKLNPAAYADKMDLVMDNVSLSAGDTLVAYLMVPPANLVGDTINIIVTGADGEVESSKVSGTNIQSGKTYNIEIPAVMSKEKIDNAENYKPGSANAVASTPDCPVAFADDLLLATVGEGELEEIQMLGDVNKDGTVTMADANLVVNYFLSSASFGEIPAAADVNKDGVVTMADANMIVNIFLDKEVAE